MGMHVGRYMYMHTFGSNVCVCVNVTIDSFNKIAVLFLKLRFPIFLYFLYHTCRDTHESPTKETHHITIFWLLLYPLGHAGEVDGHHLTYVTSSYVFMSEASMSNSYKTVASLERLWHVTRNQCNAYQLTGIDSNIIISYIIISHILWGILW